MFEIETDRVSDEFADCWRAAGRHLTLQSQGKMPWLKAELMPPFLEHLSFRLGNQLFFVRLEDVDEVISVPGSRQGLMRIAEGCQGVPCIMPMKRERGNWASTGAGWGLYNLRTGKWIDPVSLITDEKVEMTDWELHDYAVQIVRGQLEKEGRKVFSWQGNPSVDPAIWFVGEEGPNWVVVRVVRYPMFEAERPTNWNDILNHFGETSGPGHFASVSVANADDAFDSSVPPLPLWRGHGLLARFTGLDPELNVPIGGEAD